MRRQPGRRPVVQGGDLLPDGALALQVRRDRERHERFEIHLPGAVGVEEFRGGAPETDSLLDEALGDTEPGGDRGDGEAVPGQRREGDHLVGGVHVHPHDVLGQGNFGGVAVGEAAGHGVIGVERAVLGEGLQRREAPAAGDDGVTLQPVVVGPVDADDEVLQQAVGEDRGNQLAVGGLVGRGLADVLGREDEL